MKRFTYLAVALAIGLLFSVNPASAGDVFCGGVKNGQYMAVMNSLTSRLGNGSTALETGGSGQNFAGLDTGKCVAAPGQPDAALVYKMMNRGRDVPVRPIADIGMEYAHLVCNQYVAEEMGIRGRLMNISDFNNPKAKNYVIAIGSEDVGGNSTYRILMSLLPYLDPAKGGMRVNTTADPASQNTLNSVKSDSPASRLDCLFFVTAPKSEAVARVDANGAKLEMVSINDPAIFNLRDRWGSPVYLKGYIPPHYYKNLQNAKYAFFNDPVTTLAMPLRLYGNDVWMSRNPRYADLIGSWAKGLNYTRY